MHTISQVRVVRVMGRPIITEQHHFLNLFDQLKNMEDVLAAQEKTAAKCKLLKSTSQQTPHIFSN